MEIKHEIKLKRYVVVDDDGSFYFADENGEWSEIAENMVIWMQIE